MTLATIDFRTHFPSISSPCLLQWLPFLHLLHYAWNRASMVHDRSSVWRVNRCRSTDLDVGHNSWSILPGNGSAVIPATMTMMRLPPPLALIAKSLPSLIGHPPLHYVVLGPFSRVWCCLPWTFAFNHALMREVLPCHHPLSRFSSSSSSPLQIAPEHFTPPYWVTPSA
jgi:hypothetical protein